MPRRLKTEQDTPAMGRRVLAAARRAKLGRSRDLDSVFEHGQWWIIERGTGGTWAVNDAEGPGTFGGFDFEVVTRPEEEWENPSPGRKSACGSAGGKGNPVRIAPVGAYYSGVAAGQEARMLSELEDTSESVKAQIEQDLKEFRRASDDYARGYVRGWLWKERIGNPASGIQFVYGILGKGAKRVSEVQSVLFDKARYTVAQAKKWLQDHGFKHESADEGGPRAEYLRFRQQDPGKYHSMRTGEAGAKGNPDYTRFSPEEGYGRLLAYVVTAGDKIVYQDDNRAVARMEYDRLVPRKQDVVFWIREKTAPHLDTVLYRKIEARLAPEGVSENPDGTHEFYYTDESGHRIGEQTTDLESGFRLGVSLSKTYSIPVVIWIGWAQAESGWKQLGRVTPETTEDAIKRAVMLFAVHGREVNPEVAEMEPVTPSGKNIPDLRSVVYLERVRWPKYNVPVNVISLAHSDKGRLLKRRLPDWTAADHLYASRYWMAKRKAWRKEWSEVADEASQATFGRPYEATDYKISGIARDEYPESYKERLRTLARGASEALDLYEAHARASGKRSISYNPSDSRGNPESESQSAAALYEQFHGQPSSETLEYHEEIEVPDELAGLGDLTEIKVATMSGLDVTLSFENDPPKLCSTPDGRQLHILGGDQSLPLDKLKMNGDKWLRDSMVIGVLREATYKTRKSFHRFVLTEYEHRFADPKEKRSEVEPMLIYDSVNKQLSVSGGQYAISKPGIEG
jgi:hypothetical protein